MSKQRCCIALLACLMFIPMELSAQEKALPLGGRVTLGSNPVYWVLGGYHIKPSYHFPQKWSVGLTLQGGFILPDFARDQFFSHKNDSITVDWRYAIGIELKYRFTKASFDKGLYTAINLGYEGWTVEAEENEAFDNWFSSLDVGYNWYPFAKKRLHFGAQYTLIVILNNTNEQRAGDSPFNIRRLVPPSLAPSLFIGWRF
ncbi:MAG: hypothetical protein AAF206_16480 [Bacteroidota bacterium]